MNKPSPLAPTDDIDSQMLLVARNLAMDIYPLEEILNIMEIPMRDFMRWKDSPRFLSYVKSEKLAWSDAQNTPERTKLKAATVMEQYMLRAHTDIHNNALPLNHRVMLGSLLAKIAGMGNDNRMAGSDGSGSGFRLQINIGPTTLDINPRPSKPTQQKLDYETIRVEALDDDGNDLLSDPTTLDL